MRLTRAGEYAVRCALYLSFQGKGVTISRREIAGGMDIPDQFLGKIAQQLETAGIQAVAIHGNKSQTMRTKALEGFKKGKDGPGGFAVPDKRNLTFDHGGKNILSVNHLDLRLTESQYQ